MWNQNLAKALKKVRHIRGNNWVALATVEDGVPRVRTVVVRGFLDLARAANPNPDPNPNPNPDPNPNPTPNASEPREGGSSEGTPRSQRLRVYEPNFNGPIDYLLMTTDLKSCKAEHYLRQCRAGQSFPGEVCWYIPMTTDQYRIQGDIVLVGPHGAIVSPNDPSPDPSPSSTVGPAATSRGCLGDGTPGAPSRGVEHEDRLEALGLSAAVTEYLLGYRARVWGKLGAQRNDFGCDLEEERAPDNFVLMLLRATAVNHINLKRRTPH